MAGRTGVMGRVAAWASALLLAVYTVTTIQGFLSLPSPDDPMGDPWFTIMELLIVLILPFMVVSMVSLYSGAPREKKGWAMAALVFMVITAGISSSVHFVILTVSRRIGPASYDYQRGSEPGGPGRGAPWEHAGAQYRHSLPDSAVRDVDGPEKFSYHLPIIINSESYPPEA